MSTIPTQTKAAAVTMTFTVSLNLPANPNLATLETMRTTAAEAKATLAKLGGTVTGHVIIGKQKFEL